MYTTAQKKTYTAHELLQYVTQEQVFSYLGFPTEHMLGGKKFQSPFREDKHPDCRWNLGTDGKWRYLDPARGLSLDWLDAVMQCQSLAYPAALEWVGDTFIGGQGNTPTPLPEGERLLVVPSVTSKKLIQIKRRGMNGADKAWWQQFNINQGLLSEGKVWAISDYWIDGKHFMAPKKAYAYCEEDGFKIYMPENEHRYRFVGNTSSLSCYELLPQTGDLLLITSSKKDALCLRSFGYNVVAPQGEGMDIPNHILWELKQRFKKVWLLYDNDVPGITLARQKVTKWQVDGYLILPEGPKDPADCCKELGVTATHEILTNLTHELCIS